MMHKKSILFTIATLLLLLSVFTLTSAYLERNKDLQSVVTMSSTGGKFRYLEDDVVSNVYSNLLTVELGEISRSSTVNIVFNQALLVPGRDYDSIVESYKDFIEGDYSSLNNVNITLIDFGNNFTIEPYNATFEILGEDIYVYTMPLATNYVQSISVTVDVGGEKSGNCEKPQDDGGAYPEITVTYDHTAGSCTEGLQLNPQENNDKVGDQFYMGTKNPTGSIEVKYGQITGMTGDGILAILASDIVANVTQLNIEYSLNDKVKLRGGDVTIKSVVGNITKQNEILLAEE